MFSTLKITRCILYVDLDDESKGLTTFMAHMGLFRYEVLMFGLCSASDIFQRIMEQEAISGNPSVCDTMYDIIDGGPSEDSR